MKIQDRDSEKGDWQDDDDVPFGNPIMYNYKCKNCDFASDINEAHIDVAYAWTKKRSKCSDGEVVPVLECPNCGKFTFLCVD